MNSKTFLDQCKNILSDREYKIFRLYFGIDGQSMTVSQLGDEYCVRSERIKQILEKGLRKIRQARFGVRKKINELSNTFFLIQENAHTFDPEINDLIMVKILSSIYKEKILLQHKELRHAWLIPYEKRNEVIDTLESLKKLLKNSPFDWELDNLINRLVEYDIPIRQLFQDSIYYDNQTNSLPSLMPILDKFEYFVKEKSKGIVTIQEIMNHFNIDKTKAYTLICKGYYYRIGETLCYSSEKYDDNLVRLAEVLYENKKPLSLKSVELLYLYPKLSKQENTNTIKAIVESRPDIFTREGDYIGLSEWCSKKQDSPRRFYTAKLLDILVEIIKSSEKPITSTEIHNIIEQKYGKTASTNPTSIRLTLKKLYETGEIGRIGTKNEYKYFIP